MKRFLLVFVLAVVGRAGCSTLIEIEKPKKLTPTGSLSTCGYTPTAGEQTYISKVGQKELVTGSFLEPYSIKGKKDKYVSWFAIVRGISKDEKTPNQRRLLLEQKYFDGLTDCHIMMVSVSGSGDFLATVDASEADSIPMLSLARVYGKVVDEVDDLPRIEAEYVRVWPWLAFTLTDLGPEDHGNPKWRKLCKPCKGGRVYKPYPNEQYYLDVLGDPKNFAGPGQPEKQ